MLEALPEIAPRSHPRAVIFAGPNGSGKSTLIRRLQNDSAFGFPDRYINADDLARVATAGRQEERERTAFRDARLLRQTYREQGVSFAFETVFSHPSGLLDLLRLKAAGYTVALFFVATADPRLNVLRVQARIAAGGHAVPEEKIKDRYERALRFLPRAVEIADEAYVYDNSGRNLQLVALAEAGELLSEPARLPPYLQDRLAQPLVERAADRRTFVDYLQAGETPIPPDEERGMYSGAIRAVLTHYVLQEQREPQESPGRGEALGHSVLYHDRSLLSVEPTLADHGTIQYRDGYGEWVTSSTP